MLRNVVERLVQHEKGYNPRSKQFVCLDGQSGHGLGLQGHQVGTDVGGHALEEDSPEEEPRVGSVNPSKIRQHLVH